MDIFLVTYQFQHHYAVSGYNRLAEFVPCRTIRTPSLISRFIQRTTSYEQREALKAQTGLSGYFPECRWLEWQVGRRLRSNRAAVFHFIYPENSFFYTASARRSPGARVVATYHQPLEESRAFIRKTDAIRSLDAVIVLSETQREFFEPLVGPDRMFVVPHGIDLEFFTPAPTHPEGRRVIAVGNWLRDFPTLVGAMRILESAAPEITCDVVTLRDNAHFFAESKNVQFHAGIPDAQLRELYHRASAAVLSLAGAAANNALLEAQSSGLPIIATDLPAVREYTDARGCRYAAPVSAASLAEQILAVMGDEPGRVAMGAANRENAMQYSWQKVGERTMSVYRAVG